MEFAQPNITSIHTSLGVWVQVKNATPTTCYTRERRALAQSTVLVIQVAASRSGDLCWAQSAQWHCYGLVVAGVGDPHWALWCDLTGC